MARRNGEIRPSVAKSAPYAEDDDVPMPAPGGTSVDLPPSRRDDGTDPGLPPPRRSPEAGRRRPAPNPKLRADELFTPAGQIDPPPGDFDDKDNRTRVLDTRQPTQAKGSGRGELIVRAGPVAGLQFTLHAGAVVVVGRSSQADCTIPDEAVSRRHFELRVTPAGVHIRDLGSGNGTLVNGKKIEEMALSDGDRIVVGDSTLEYRDRHAKAAPAGDRSRARTDFVAQADAEPQTWFLGRMPEKQRRIVAFAAVAFVFIIVFGMVGIGQSKKRAEERLAIKAFQRARQEMAAAPPDPDAALDDLQLSIRAYPDPQMVREAIADAQAMSMGMRQLTHARELVDQKDFDGARKLLPGLPKTDYFASAGKLLEDDMTKKENALKAEAAATSTVDPTTMAEVHELWQKAKKLENSSPDGAISAYDQAYDMLQKRGAVGPEFDKLKADYAAFLLKTSQALKRRNPAKSVALEGRARGISPEAVATAESPPAAAQIRPISHPSVAAHPAKKRHHGGATSHAKAAPATPAAAAEEEPEPAKAKPAAGSKYDDDHAEQLCDEGDALIGQDPDAAKRKYAEALKFAHPGSQAANRAREGLNN